MRIAQMGPWFQRFRNVLFGDTERPMLNFVPRRYIWTPASGTATDGYLASETNECDAADWVFLFPNGGADLNDQVWKVTTPQTAVATALTNVATSLVVTSGDGVRLSAGNTGSTVAFWAKIEDEIVKATAWASADTFTITRGVVGTAVAHAAGTKVCIWPYVPPSARVLLLNFEVTGSGATGDLAAYLWPGTDAKEGICAGAIIKKNVLASDLFSGQVIVPLSADGTVKISTTGFAYSTTGTKLRLSIAGWWEYCSQYGSSWDKTKSQGNP